MKSVSIIIGGDIAPTRTNYSYFEQGDINALIDKELMALIQSTDYRIFNLETPLTDTKSPIIKDGPNLIAPVSTIAGVKLFNPTVFGLANNHIMDQDNQGLFQTIELLTASNIEHVGAGENLEKAKEPLIMERNGIRIGIYACAEHEYSIAELNKAGANPFDALESPDHITDLKSRCDYVLVLYHGGKELYRYPSPYLVKVCRKMVDKGADLVLCQHSHCIGAFEKYSDGIILYGQGNFIFDRADDEFWNTSLLVKATFGQKLTVEFIPFRKNGAGIGMPQTEEKKQILDSFNERSANILIPGFIKKEYDKFCIENGLFYMGVFAGLGRVLRKADRMSNGVITNQLFSLKKINMIQNFLECEAQRELVITYLKLKRIKFRK